MPLRVGEISYTNILPCFYYLNRNELKEIGCEFMPQVPAKLNRAMAANEIDVGGISSFSYGEHSDSYTLLPNLSVSSYGAVGSIFLFSKQPIEQLSGKRVALTSASATSVHLLKIILQAFYELDVEYTVMKPDFAFMLEQYDACLLIGDDAIRASWKRNDSLYRYDLGALWYEHTGMPMTYAVFAVRDEALKKQTALIAELCRAFTASKEQSDARKYKDLIEEVIKRKGGNQAFWANYFTGLSHDFGNNEQKALHYYFRLAHEMGFLKEPVQSIRVWDTVLY